MNASEFDSFHPLKASKEDLLRSWNHTRGSGCLRGGRVGQVPLPLWYFHLTVATDPSLIQFLPLITHTHINTRAHTKHLHRKRSSVHMPTQGPHAYRGTRTHIQEDGGGSVCCRPGREECSFLLLRRVKRRYWSWKCCAENQSPRCWSYWDIAFCADSHCTLLILDAFIKNVKTKQNKKINRGARRRVNPPPSPSRRGPLKHSLQIDAASCVNGVSQWFICHIWETNDWKSHKGPFKRSISLAARG